MTTQLNLFGGDKIQFNLVAQTDDKSGPVKAKQERGPRLPVVGMADAPDWARLGEARSRRLGFSQR